MSELLRQQLTASLGIEAIKAFVSAQSEMTAAHKGKVNPAFRSKYAELSDVMDACMPALRNHGFAVLQPIGRDEQGDFVETLFCHASGHQFSTRVYLILGKNDMQGFKSAVTYARRIGLGALAGVTDTDDDGNAAAKSRQRPPERPQEPLYDEDGVIPPARNNPAQAASDGLKDAWIDAIKDAMSFDCADMTKLHPAQKLQFWGAVSDALIDAFKKLKTGKGVSAQWSKRDDLIMEMQIEAPAAYHRTLDAFNERMADFAPEEPLREMLRAGTFGG